MTALLESQNLDVGYNGRAVVKGLNIHVAAGEIISLFGPNGAGKTTSLLTLSGAIPSISGTIKMFGKETSAPLHMRVREGMAFITDERSLIHQLSARDNLRLRGGSVETALSYFPELEPHLDRPAALLSGGQQQMLAVSRALAARPKLLLADELSLGLAPMLTKRLLKALRAAANDGLGVVLVEQHVSQALAISDHAHVLGQGRILLEGDANSLKQRVSEIESAYLGGEAPD
tara:strand:+ start:2252 stop:2947 length:696 start_codon:yes stop_codon:yes gene_type:complete